MAKDSRDGAARKLEIEGSKLTAQSGVSFHEAQVALARIYVGADDISGGDINEVVNIEKPHDSLTGADQVGKKDTVAKAVPLPTTLEEVCLSRYLGRKAIAERIRLGILFGDLSWELPRTIDLCEFAVGYFMSPRTTIRQLTR